MKQKTKAPLDYAENRYDEYTRRRRHKSTVKELLAWIGILVAVAGIIAVLSYTAYVTNQDLKAARQRANVMEMIIDLPSWETKEAQE